MHFSKEKQIIPAGRPILAIPMYLILLFNLRELRELGHLAWPEWNWPIYESRSSFFR